MVATAQLFVIDQAFTDYKDPIHQILNTVDVARPSTKALSYFNDVSLCKDTRAAASRQVNWNGDTVPSFIFDDKVASDFATALKAVDSKYVGDIFALIDRVAFYVQTGDNATVLDTALQALDGVKDIYVAGSLSYPSATSAAAAYQADGTTVNVTCPTYFYAELFLPIGSTPTQFGVTFWISNAAFEAGYSISTIISVVPPIDYTTILSASLTDNQSNVFSVATKSSNLNYATINAQIDAVNASGYLTYLVTLHDTSGATLSIPFNLLYKGSEPTTLQISDAIQAAVLASGVGTQADWEARTPELFVVSRFFLIPMWDETIVRAGGTIAYQSLTNILTASAKITALFPSSEYKNQLNLIDLMLSSYNRMFVVSVPDINNPTGSQTLAAQYPDYQCYGSTDSNFALMTTATQQFVNDLSDTLAVASGKTAPTTQRLVTSSGLEYYAFSEGSSEYLVMTMASYTAALAAAVAGGKV